MPIQSNSETNSNIRSAVDDIYKTDSRRIFATLVRLISDFDLAEEVLQEAFATAVQKWQDDGIPSNPRAWLVSTARFKAIDAMRRQNRFNQTIAEHGESLVPGFDKTEEIEDFDEECLNDDHLRLIFTCCHPALSSGAQIALTLREVCGLTTDEIASAFMTPSTTIAQRIVRAKAKIRDAKIPYIVPSRDELPERLESVLSVVYLMFNEGYSTSSGAKAIRPDLSDHAIHLGELLLELIPDSEIMGLLALMLLHESRRDARLDSHGDLILMENQDRSKWKQNLIAAGRELIERAIATSNIGSYTIQAAISAEHARVSTFADTNWSQIVSLYDLLNQADPSPVVELNRAVAVAMRDGPEAGLTLIDSLLNSGQLIDYHFAHSAKAEFNRRLGKFAEAKAAYQVALTLAKQEPERRFLEKRLQELEAPAE